jgi:glutamate 5-kinase
MEFDKFNRVVLKLGSSIITDEDGKIRSKWLKSLASDLANLKKQKKDVIIVTSGSVALGRKFINKPKGKLKLEEKQAAAACGQIELMRWYKDVFEPLNVAQVLLTAWDTEKRRSYLNAKSAIETMLKAGVIPVINENDVVATTELHYGDNDRLSARVAQMLGADLLIIFSDIGGLYTDNPNTNKDAKHIPEVREITKQIENMAGDPTSSVGTGGMRTKIEAAKIAVRAGCDCIITNGNSLHPLKNLISGKQLFTRFVSQTTPLNARKQWIVSGVKPMGEIIIDKGAATALTKGKSLLPAGATDVKGKFERGDLVIVKTTEGIEVARGLTAYSIEDATRIIGKKSIEIEKILGYAGRQELLHRDDMVITLK